MVADPFRPCHPAGVTAEEFQRLLLIRRETLEDAIRRACGGTLLPVAWRTGWKACLQLQGRDRDGSLKAVISVTAPEPSGAYVRRVRLCKPHRVHLKHS